MMESILLAMTFQQILDKAKGCPPHAIAAMAGAFVVGLLLGIIITKAACSKKKKNNKPIHLKRPASGKFAYPTASTGPTRVAIPSGSVEIYAGNLSYDLTEDLLRKEFEKFGTVTSARVVVNHFNNRAKGFGFVVMPNRAEAEKAIAAMNDKEVLGRKMRVNEARNTLKSEG
jgi:RNA recognition motif-containing protein